MDIIKVLLPILIIWIKKTFIHLIEKIMDFRKNERSLPAFEVTNLNTLKNFIRITLHVYASSRSTQVPLFITFICHPFYW